jgi:hypothetical protein
VRNGKQVSSWEEFCVEQIRFELRTPLERWNSIESKPMAITTLHIISSGLTLGDFRSDNVRLLSTGISCRACIHINTALLT